MACRIEGNKIVKESDTILERKQVRHLLFRKRQQTSYTSPMAMNQPNLSHLVTLNHAAVKNLYPE